MKSRLCYAWFGDEDVKSVFFPLDKKTQGDGQGETAPKTAPGHDARRWDTRREPPHTQPIFKTP
ncbi:hypothetical protein [Luteolibacter soli]|uniref:Uncharacterized protein n=1 Tax=Luteolibacter soli TaxID=3135280 RepID=A0ABU9ANF1_9BACT